jgi:shikimate 5-dehydrogenase
VKINKDTIVCISLAKKAGNFGTTIYNHIFEKEKMNFLYKAFSTKDLKTAIQGARALNIRGVSITMPYKEEVLNYVDELSEEVKDIGAANTILNDNGKLIAYNTDCDSTFEVINRYRNFKTIHILGNGGFSKAVQYSANKIFKEIKIYTRENWEEIKKIKSGLIFNCTPVKGLKFNKEIVYVDCDTNTDTGKELAILQAAKQFNLYTKKDFPTMYILKNLDNIIKK